MKSFKTFLTEAYDFFPTKADSIPKVLKDWPKEKVDDVVKLFNFLKKKDPTPINIDLGKQTEVNVIRPLKGGSMDLDGIISGSGITTFRLKWGNGSSGNRGANNRGNAFETEFADALYDWFEKGDEAVKDDKILAAILDLDREYNLSGAKEMWVDVVGGENTRRPLKYASNSITLVNTKGSGLDIGPNVTDITITPDNGKDIYLSLKFETTTTFFNVGTTKAIKKDEVKAGEIQHKDGKAILKMFGIENKRFCKIFTDKKPKGKIVKTKPNKKMIQGLLQSGIGYGYHVIHKMKGKVISKKMDSKAMKAAANVGDCIVYYGGKTGTGRRIDMEMKSADYTFKLNIRDTAGKDGLPNRMMCDFSYNK